MADSKMEYVRLGNSGLKISKIILGTMGYGSKQWQDWVLDEEDSLPLIEHAYKQGINTWDTRRGGLPPIAACATNDGPIVNRVGLSRKHIFDAVDASVKRLGTYIDVLQIHRLDRETPREEIMRALNDVVESGKVRYIGASSMAAWEFQTLQNIADRKGWHKFISMQNFHNLLFREEEREMIPYCQDTGVGLIPWSPIARGALAKPWGSRESVRENSDGALKMFVRSRESEADKAIIDRVEELAKKKGVSMAQIAIAWSLTHKGVNPIVGLHSVKRIDEAVDAIKVQLSQEEIKYLEEPYVPKVVTALERMHMFIQNILSSICVVDVPNVVEELSGGWLRREPIIGEDACSAGSATMVRPYPVYSFHLLILSQHDDTFNHTN
ncbi:uncharacterized protein N7515_003566 [Penicillium bovifimosum]|uniref:NADP-dependent oxidoreductase domain-containing protein n=1 Tax=Penicillium bovifimosum TaxID=126998 RepID=A0A9W9L4T2_9EURO|nr:uncharacterized protein N7515_003566 [Penicillium bovifimosum]KAJ5138718.1 hypothetical protein N7515_003566 [Penicillium bovifimosum]